MENARKEDFPNRKNLVDAEKGRLLTFMCDAFLSDHRRLSETKLKMNYFRFDKRRRILLRNSGVIPR